MSTTVDYKAAIQHPIHIIGFKAVVSLARNELKNESCCSYQLSHCICKKRGNMCCIPIYKEAFTSQNVLHSLLLTLWDLSKDLVHKFEEESVVFFNNKTLFV